MRCLKYWEISLRWKGSAVHIRLKWIKKPASRHPIKFDWSLKFARVHNFFLADRFFGKCPMPSLFICHCHKDARSMYHFKSNSVLSGLTTNLFWHSNPSILVGLQNNRLFLRTHAVFKREVWSEWQTREWDWEAARDGWLLAPQRSSLRAFKWAI